MSVLNLTSTYKFQIAFRVMCHDLPKGACLLNHNSCRLRTIISQGSFILDLFGSSQSPLQKIVCSGPQPAPPHHKSGALVPEIATAGPSVALSAGLAFNGPTQYGSTRLTFYRPTRTASESARTHRAHDAGSVSAFIESRGPHIFGSKR